MLRPKKESKDLRYKTIDQDSRRKYDNELNRLVLQGWEPLEGTYRVTPLLGGLTGKYRYSIMLKKSV